MTCYLLPNATVQEKQKLVTSYLEVYCVELQTEVREDLLVGAFNQQKQGVRERARVLETLNFF